MNRLLNCLLVSLLQSLHLLLLLVASVNGFPHRTTDRATYILATMVMTEHVSRTHTVWDQTFLVLAFSNMLPESLHTGAVRSDGTTSIFVLTFRGMSEQ